LAVAGLWCVGCYEATPAPVARSDGGYFVPQPSDAGPRDGGGFEAGDGGPADWAGKWVYVSGSQGNLCGGTIAIIATEGFLDITPSASGTTLTVVDDGCPFTFDLDGNVATEEPGQACPAWAIQMVPEWTLTMQPDGTLLEKIGGRVVEGGEVCTLSGGGTLARQ
jgi:hypothetical protein